MHRVGTLNTLIQSCYILWQLIRLSLLYMALPWNVNIIEKVQLSVDCDTVMKYSAILFVNLHEDIVEFMQ